MKIHRAIRKRWVFLIYIVSFYPHVIFAIKTGKNKAYNLFT